MRWKCYKRTVFKSTLTVHPVVDDTLASGKNEWITPRFIVASYLSTPNVESTIVTFLGLLDLGLLINNQWYSVVSHCWRMTNFDPE